MNPLKSISFCVVNVAMVALYATAGIAQTTAPATPAPAKAPEADENPFAPQPAVPLPPGMTGSDTNDPRYNLKPGLFDAGEVALGMKHVAFLKKPDAFQITAKIGRAHV